MESLIDTVPGIGGADPMLPRFERVSRVRRELADVWTIEIDTPAGFPFAAGQFNMLYVHGVGEAAISISGDPAEPDRLVHTIRAVGKVSQALTRLEPGNRVGVRGPFGRGWRVDTAAGADVVVVAGGLGLAPLRPAIYNILGERKRYGRFFLLNGARSPADLLYRRQLETWRRRLDLEIAVTVDHAGGDWRGNVGVVTTLIGRAGFDPRQTVALVCGPEIMMRYAAAAFAKAGLADAAIHVSMERNMKCAIGHCGHCQFATSLVCRDGPVYSYDRIRTLLGIPEI